MKKLFLQSGKLMCGEFPEEPKWHEFPTSPSGCDYEIRDEQRDDYNAAVSAAKAGAVEVVNPICGAQYEFMKEGQLYDTPEGWTVEIVEQYKFSDYWDDVKKFTVLFIQEIKEQSPPDRFRTIARLIPETLPNSDQKASNQPEKLSKVSGIAAVGVPEYDFKHDLRETNPIKEALKEAGIPESGEKDYEQYYKTPPNDRDWAWYLRGLKEGYGQAEFEGHKRPVPWPPKKVESVSPPPQESVINLEALKRICYHFSGIVAPGWQPNAGSAFDTEWDEWLSTGKIVDWHQHPDDSKEVVKVEDLTRKP